MIVFRFLINYIGDFLTAFFIYFFSTSEGFSSEDGLGFWAGRLKNHHVDL